MKNYYKAVIFTKTPLKGYFRFENEFQVYPVDEEFLPDSEKFKHYPIFLEFKINENDIVKPTISIDGFEDVVSKEQMIETATIQSKQDNLINLLNLFSTFKFFRYTKTEGYWVLPFNENMTEEQIKSTSRSNFNFAFFWNKEINLDIVELTNVSAKYDKVEVIDYSSYYQNDPNYDYSFKKVTFPNNINHGISAYYKLDSIERKTIDSAIKYSVLCMDLMHEKTTLAILSAFTSIETIMNFYYKDFKPENCKECGQPRYKISKKYIDFLLEFIGNGTGFKKRFNELYKLRSKIVHTGFSFETEKFWNELNDEDSESETATILEIVMLSKLSVINYLILPFLGKKPKHI